MSCHLSICYYPKVKENIFAKDLFSMELSTSTCIFPAHRQGGRHSLIESIDMCYECGFRHIDLNFCSASNKKSGSELLGDDWETKIDEIGNHAAKLGVVFTQSHAPFDSNLYRNDIPPLTDEYREWYDESVKRSIIASARLGVKWVVTHAQTATTDAEMSREYNIKIKTVMDRFKAITADADEYKTFSGIADDMNGTVKFIFQTEEIKNK